MRRCPQRGSAPTIINPAGLRTGSDCCLPAATDSKPQVVHVAPAAHRAAEGSNLSRQD